MADRTEEAEGDALRSQLVTLEAQREQLASLLDGNEEGPMQQLQEELNTAIDGIRQRLGAAATGTPSQPREVAAGGSQFAVGDTCLAPRVFDRRRALAVVEAVDAPRATCLVTWVHPRQKREIVCRYWKEGRNCKFSGRDCSFSHGIEVLLADLLSDNNNNRVAGAEQSSLREPSGTERWLATLGADSRLLARYHDRVWYDATAEGPAVNGRIAVCFTGFEDEGSVSLPIDLSHLAPPEDQVDDAAGRRGVSGGGGAASLARADDEESELEDAWAEEVPDGDDSEGDTFFRERVLGDRQENAGGSSAGRMKGADGGGSLLTDAYVFGDWEQHTKGFGSRMMSRMGYRRGEGLGKEKQGIPRPVPIRVLPERRALDHLRVDDGRSRPRAQSGLRNKKSKPGRCSSAGDDGEPQKAMFDFLNVTIHASAKDKGGAASSGPARSSLAGRRPVFEGKPSTSASVGSAAQEKSGGAGAGNMTRSQLRSHLVGAREAEAALAEKAARLEETVARNSERDPRIAAAAKQKLEEVRVQAREVRASMDQAERVLGHRKEGKGSGKGGLFSF